MNSEDTHECSVCDAPAQMRCSACKTTWYCSAEHQKLVWKGSHEALCGKDDNEFLPPPFNDEERALAAKFEHCSVPGCECRNMRYALRFAFQTNDWQVILDILAGRPTSNKLATNSPWLRQLFILYIRHWLLPHLRHGPPSSSKLVKRPPPIALFHQDAFTGIHARVLKRGLGDESMSEYFLRALNPWCRAMFMFDTLMAHLIPHYDRGSKPDVVALCRRWIDTKVPAAIERCAVSDEDKAFLRSELARVRKMWEAQLNAETLPGLRSVVFVPGWPRTGQA
ncbi:hypothetical protein JCM10207_002143 [Rhodosporidiobolus poonsookiae]